MFLREEERKTVNGTLPSVAQTTITTTYLRKKDEKIETWCEV
jgi:hypothetical protein